MKKTLVVVAGLVTSALCYAAFVPMQSKERASKSVLIIKGTVKKVEVLFDAKPTKGVGQIDGHYFGPSSVAVVDIEEIWKLPDNGTCFVPNQPKEHTLPMQVLVPCDYTYEESPADLTAGRTYVLFLEQMGSNFYHPTDKASTHVVHDGRVAKFGMNLQPGQDFSTESIPLAEFREQIRAHLVP